MQATHRQLIPVLAQDLRKWWDVIKPGIDACRQSSADDWIPEDIYHAVKSGLSFLYVGQEDGEYVGFLVLTPIQTYAAKVLHVWLCYSAAESTFDYLGELDNIARSLGISKITHTSARKGWQRIDAFEQISINYQRSVK